MKKETLTRPAVVTLLAYCAGQAEQDGVYLNRTRIRRIPMEALKG